MASTDTKYVQMASLILTERRYVDQRDIRIVHFQLPLQGTITTQWPPIAIYLTFQTVSSKHKATVHGQYISIALVQRQFRQQQNG